MDLNVIPYSSCSSGTSMEARCKHSVSARELYKHTDRSFYKAWEGRILTLSLRLLNSKVWG